MEKSMENKIKSVCPVCGTRLTQILGGEPLGCPECYRAFYAALVPFTGKAPVKQGEKHAE